MISLAFTVSGLRFLATTLITRSRSVIIPIDFPALLVTTTAPKSCISILAAALLEVSPSSIVTTGLLITSLTIIFVLNPISAIVKFTSDNLVGLATS